MENHLVIRTEKLTKRFPMGKGEFMALKGINLSLGLVNLRVWSGPAVLVKRPFSILWIARYAIRRWGHCAGTINREITSREAARLRKENLGFIFQSYNLLAVHTVFENVEFPLLLLDYTTAERKKMVMDALEWVGLTDKVKQKPPQLSAANASGWLSPAPWSRNLPLCLRWTHGKPGCR